MCDQEPLSHCLELVKPNNWFTNSSIRSFNTRHYIKSVKCILNLIHRSKHIESGSSKSKNRSVSIEKYNLYKSTLAIFFASQ